MNSLSQPSHSLPSPVAFAMLSYSAKLLLTETSTTPVQADSAKSTTDELARRATAITITIKSVEGYAHYGIND